jgi:hypothetical protein
MDNCKLSPFDIQKIIMMGTSYFSLRQAVGEVFKEGVEFRKSQNE